MKKMIYLFAVLMVPAFVLAQPGTPVIKGIAWQQSTAGGAKPSAVAGERGNANSAAVYPSRLFIYLEHKNGQRLLPFRIWINGQPYRVNNKPVSKSPVVRERPGVGTSSAYDTLVAATRNGLVQIEAGAPIKNISIPLSQGVPAHPDAGKIVVEYYWKAKTYALTIPEIKVLEAVRLQ
jgi:hypothetical protein